MQTGADFQPKTTMHLRDACLDALPAAQWREAAHDGVAVALCSGTVWDGRIGAMRTLLDPAERARVDRKRRPPDRDITQLAYACHRQVLAIVLDCAPESVPLHRDARGCPRLDGRVCWTSLGHADPFVAVAVSTRGPVGIDIEPGTRAAEMAGIAQLIGDAVETSAIAALPEAQRGQAWLALWVRKEALLKAAGIGLAESMTSFPAPTGTPLRLPGDGDGVAEIRMLAATPSHSGIFAVGAVAGPAGCPVVERWIG